MAIKSINYPNKHLIFEKSKFLKPLSKIEQVSHYNLKNFETWKKSSGYPAFMANLLC